MNPDLVNIYITRILKEVEELTKNRLLIETQLLYTEQINVSLSQKIKQLEEQLEKQNKKLNKKEVNTSDTF
jgi:retron-type reverse transcriptase